MLPLEIEQFLAELAEFHPTRKLRAAIVVLDLEADGNTNAAQIIEAVRWVSRQPRTLAEKVHALGELCDFCELARDRSVTFSLLSLFA